MRNKKAIIVLTIIITALSLYNLSFTLISRRVQKEATEVATNDKGLVDLNKKQKYLDSIYTEPVFNFLGLDYTFQEIKEKELGLGLDLQGGMHVVLEVSPVEILKALAGANAVDPGFKLALNRAKELQKNSQENFTDLFYKAYAEVNQGRPLTAIFNNTITAEKGKIESDDDVKRIINDEVGDAINRAEKIIRTRIDKFGVIQPNIQRLQGSSRIQVELPGVDNPQRVRNLLQGVAQLEFMPVYFMSEIGPNLERVNDYLITIEKPEASLKTDTTTKASNANKLLESTDSTGTTTADSDSSTVAKEDSAATDSAAASAKISSLLKLRKGQYGLYYSLKDTAKINRIFAMPKVKALLPPNTAFLWTKPKMDVEEGEEVVTELVPVKTQKGKTLSGEVVTNARVDSDMKKGGTVQVAMTMNDAGTKKWKQMTKEATQEREPGTGSFRRIAVVLDKTVYSAPTVQNEIPNGQSVITGNFTIDEAQDLANILEAGKLPAPVRIVEEVVIGPSLGKEAISQGLNSMLVGLLIVIAFMIFYYSKAGVIANVALLFNILFILGIMANFNSVLTLPGIAGIVLTIGMAVDANVLIFERIREELRNGKTIIQAINLGYDKAFSSIFDSNVTTIITGAILAWLGSGPVQGFAVTLIIGLVCSFFTAVYISKVIVLWLAKNNDPKSITFSTVISRDMFRNLHFNIINKRKIAYIGSSIVIIAGIVSIALQGLNLGVDFKGGRSYIVQFKESVTASDLRESLKDNFKDAGIEVKAYGSNSKMKITTSYLVNDESSEADAEVESVLVAGLKEFKGNTFEIQSTSKVGATVADDIVWDSIKALFFSLIGIFIYVYFRFKKWQFSLGGVVALFHDALFVVAMFAILHLFGYSYEIDQVFVAAILTIVGFSINDTVIVFDRIREFTAENPRVALPTVINNAINDTLSRTIITTLTVLIVVLILLIFGGETLRGFSLAMLIGVIAGSYSTLFIAAPMVLDIRSKKEKEEALATSKSVSVK